jgi:hypothetical protein
MSAWCLRAFLVAALASSAAAGEALDAAVHAYLRHSRPLAAAEPKPAKADLAAAVQNPIASTISVPFENNWNFGAGGGVQYVLNLQPVIPMRLTDDWNLIHRPIVPIVYNSSTLLGAPRPPGPGGEDWGLGDTLYAAYFSPSKPTGKWIWGVAPAVLVPTSTSDAFGQGKWGLGVSGVALSIRKPWLFGSLVTQVWTFERGVDQFLWQPFATYNLPGGWFLETAPQVTAAWDLPSSRRWQIPVGGGVGKIVTVGRQPMALRLQFYWNVERPDNGPEALLRFTITLLFPKG